jgi:hypothetical protein
LLEAVKEDIVDEGVEQMQSIVKESGGNALDKIHKLFPARNLMKNNGEILGQLHRPDNLGMYARVLLVSLQKQAPVFAQLVEQGCDEGIFHTDSPLVQ